VYLQIVPSTYRETLLWIVSISCSWGCLQVQFRQSEELAYQIIALIFHKLELSYWRESLPIERSLVTLSLFIYVAVSSYIRFQTLEQIAESTLPWVTLRWCLEAFALLNANTRRVKDFWNTAVKNHQHSKKILHTKLLGASLTLASWGIMLGRASSSLLSWLCCKRLQVHSALYDFLPSGLCSFRISPAVVLFIQLSCTPWNFAKIFAWGLNQIANHLTMDAANSP